MSKRKEPPAGFAPDLPHQEPTPPAPSGSANVPGDDAAGETNPPREQGTDDAAPPRQSNAPICPIHKIPTKAQRSPQAGNAFFTYYRCTVPGCTFSHKQPRKTIKQRLAEQQGRDPFSAR